MIDAMKIPLPDGWRWKSQGPDGAPIAVAEHRTKDHPFYAVMVSCSASGDDIHVRVDPPLPRGAALGVPAEVFARVRVAHAAWQYYWKVQCTTKGDPDPGHPLTATALRHYFKFDHLPPHLQSASSLFYEVAHLIALDPKAGGPPLVECLARLAEAKDWSVRARLEGMDLARQQEEAELDEAPGRLW